MKNHKTRMLCFLAALCGLLWSENGSSVILGLGKENAWAAHRAMPVSSILSPGKELGMIDIRITIRDEPLIRGIDAQGDHAHLTARVNSATLQMRDGVGETITSAPAENQEGARNRNDKVGNQPFENKDGLISMEALERPISEVIARIAQVGGVEIVVFDQIDSTTISVKMKDRPIEQAIGTILRGYSYSVVYNAEKQKEGVRIVQQPKRDPRLALASAHSSIASRIAGNESPLVLITEETQGPTASEAANKEKSASKGTQLASATAEQPGKKDETSEPGASAAGDGELPQNAAETPPEPAPQELPQVARLSSDVAQSQAQHIVNSEGYVGLTFEERAQRMISMYERRMASGVSDREYERNMRLSGGGHVIHDRDQLQFWNDILKRHSGN